MDEAGVSSHAAYEGLISTENPAGDEEQRGAGDQTGIYANVFRI